MIRAIALDDEPLALQLLKTFSARFDYIHFEKGFSSTIEALKYLESHPVDLLFLDINMPAISGMDFYKALVHKPMLIFTTSYSEYALESYNLDAIDYLLKPFTLTRFEKAIAKAYEMHNLVHHAAARDTANDLKLKVDHGFIKLSLSGILFIEGLDNYLKIHLRSQPPVVVRMTMKSLMEKLDPKDFVRVHRSYIVAIRHIDSVRNKTINIAGEEIPIGKNYEQETRQIINGPL